MQKLIVDRDGQEVEVLAERVGSATWFHFDGKTVSLESESKQRNKGQSKSLSPGQVGAPMPGKILKVNVNVGDSVEAEQVVVVMEAMKMEYSLKTDIAGTVKASNVQVGDQVTKDQLLVEVGE